MHYYDEHGNDVFDIIGKNGKKRKPNIKDVRERNLYPSVTTIMGVLHAPELETWKLNNVYKATKEFGHILNKDEVFNKAFEKSEAAKDFGTYLHRYLEDVHKGVTLEYPTIPNETKDAIKAVFKDKIAKVIHAEKALVDKEIGFAGRTDLICLLNDGRVAIIDYKNQTTLSESGEEKKIAIYEKTFMQVGAYCHMAKIDVGIVFTVSRDQPGRVEWRELTKEELNKSIAMFKHIAYFYNLKNKIERFKNENCY